ncbi:MAG TPA: hypothetical protein PLN64_01590 [Candidatus Bipolaricaulis anaerobius]|nr:hypothetical protein [Candidatus Bipolaricaulis anaerobius]
MGLDISHDAFCGPYSAFNRFRQAIAAAVGGSFPPHDDESLDPDAIYWPDDFESTNPGLVEFLIHSDCDGDIEPGQCALIAGELEALLPAIEKLGGKYGGGHIARGGGLTAVVERFIRGCRDAAEAGEPLEFY